MKRVLCLGDSNTYGYDPRSYFGSRYPRSVRWTALLEKAGYTIINCGENGLSIPDQQDVPAISVLIRRFLPLDAVTVMLGSNDLLCGASAEETGERMETLLRCILDSAGGVPILLIAPPPMEPGEWVSGGKLIGESRKLAEIYRTLAAKLGVHFADASEWNAPLAFDGVHLLPEGHAAFAEGAAHALGILTGVSDAEREGGKDAARI